MRHLSTFVFAVALSATAVACAGPSANARLLGVQQAAPVRDANVLVVFVQLENPTQRDLRLSRLDYSLAASPVFATRGSVMIDRSVPATGHAVVQIDVRLGDSELARARADKLPYALEGILVAEAAGGVEARWHVKTKGALTPTASRVKPHFVLAPSTYE